MPRLASIFVFIAASLQAAAPDFAKDVYPVLQRACFECHGSETQKGGLRLDIASPKHAETGSELLRRIALPKEDKDAMPKRGERLTAAQIDRLRDWIDAGARWPDTIENLKHWSYIPPARPPLPDVQNNAWPRTGIDRFILAKLEANKLSPSPEAPPEILIRRLSLDLTGLPPTPAEVDAFVAECRTGSSFIIRNSSWEKLVDRLLASDQFGVRWARLWLDLARYADSHGFQRDDLREVWAWRDWVVDALNANMPFDQFTLEQIAGDLLPNATPAQIIATGFHRCTPTNVEAGTEPEESRINQVIDRVNTTGAVWLGTTLECAQCHNHKYDPFSQRDFYSLLAFYNNTEKEAERTNPNVPGSIQFKGSPYQIKDSSREEQRQQLAGQMQALDARIAARQQQIAGPAAARSTPVDAAKPIQPLKPTSFITASDAESELQADGSVLLTGPVPETDIYTFETDLSPGELNGIMLEALTHPSIPGDGPGRGGANRPNFVLHTFDCTLTTPDGKKQPLTFKTAYADYSQGNYAVTSLVTKAAKKGWAIGRRFGEPHWAAFELARPLTIPAGSKLSIHMEQNFGNGLVMGCLRISSITGDVASCLPEVEDSEAKTAAKPKDKQLAQLEKQKTALQKQITALASPTTEVMREMAEPRMTAIFKRGVYTDPAEKVTPAVPAIFNSKLNGPSNRVALGKWLASRDNPLAARVTVNRWWAEIFGQGIVTTLEDFGIKGSPPSHPELLDWLAVEFMDSGWDMKHVLKKIVMSAAYRQNAEFGVRNSESANPHSAIRIPHAVDPANTLLWHGPRFRLDAESIRDNALSIAGLLSLKQGGAPIRPPQPDGLWQKVGGQQYNYVVSPGAEKHRRGLYVVLKRGSPYPSFVNFDASARMACVVRRSRSNTPLQALTLLNDPVYVEAAKAFARRIVAEAASNDLDSRLQHAFRIALARKPQPQELAVLKSLWETQFESAKADATAANELAAGFELPKNLPVTEFAAWYAVASAILNLDECITKG